MRTDIEDFNDSVNPNSQFIKELEAKLPDFFNSEGAFDNEKFQNALRLHNIDELNEGYQLNFIGKDYARRQAGELPASVIVPEKKHKQSENLFFTGDNLEVLRHLQRNYSGKVNVIYIDPPYNTGKDNFSYPDKFEYSDRKLQEMFGFDDSQLKHLKSIQGKSNHSAWLTFMYPRLVLAKRLLIDSGVIFISIDDGEYAGLKMILDEIYGEACFAGSFVWKRTDTPANLSKTIKQSTEHILCYSNGKNNSTFSGMKKSSSSNNGLMNQTNSEHELTFPANYVDTKMPDGKHSKGVYGTSSYEIILLNDVEVRGGYFVSPVKLKGKFKWSQKNLDSEIKRGTQISIKTKAFSPSYEKTEYSPEVPPSLIDSKVQVGTNDEAQKYVNDFFDKKTVFTNPKPVSLIQYLLNFVPNPNALILDFFAGSSTTAEAVLRMNAEDGGNRKFIMATLDEPTFSRGSDGVEVPTKGGKVAYEAGFHSIAEISRARILRAATRIKSKLPASRIDNFDGNFNHYRVVFPGQESISEIDEFDPNSASLFNNVLNSFSSDSLGLSGNITGEQTILTTWLAMDGYRFNVKIEYLDFNQYKAFRVENRLYLISDGWTSDSTKDLINRLGKHELDVQTVVLFGYSFNIAELRELENGLKQLDSSVSLIKRY